MNLTENEKRMVYQIESTCQVAILNEIAMNKRYAPNPELRQTAESLLSKLRLLSDKECMALVNDIQKNYRLPGKARTIGEMLAEARQKSGVEKLTGHDIMALERFDPDTRHMIVFDVLSDESPLWDTKVSVCGYSSPIRDTRKPGRTRARDLSRSEITPK